VSKSNFITDFAHSRVPCVSKISNISSSAGGARARHAHDATAARAGPSQNFHSQCYYTGGCTQAAVQFYECSFMSGWEHASGWQSKSCMKKGPRRCHTPSRCAMKRPMALPLHASSICGTGDVLATVSAMFVGMTICSLLQNNNVRRYCPIRPATTSGRYSLLLVSFPICHARMTFSWKHHCVCRDPPGVLWSTTGIVRCALHSHKLRVARHDVSGMVYWSRLSQICDPP